MLEGQLIQVLEKLNELQPSNSSTSPQPKQWVCVTACNDGVHGGGISCKFGRAKTSTEAKIAAKDECLKGGLYGIDRSFNTLIGSFNDMECYPEY